MKRDIEFLFEIGCFRYVQRTWKRFYNPDVANTTEHTFRVMWIAITLAKYEKNINHEKLLKMAMIHDIPESRTGDVDYVSRLYTARNEKSAGEDIFEGTIHHDALALFEEYEKRESIESKIIKDADTLDVELEIVEQNFRGHAIGSIWNEKRKNQVFTTLTTKTAQKFWVNIHKINPHSWHMNAKNRLNTGDWKPGKNK